MKKIELIYDAKWCKRIGKVFETKIKVNKREYNPRKWRMIEKSEEGIVIDECVAFQYDPHNHKVLSSGTLSVFLKGESTYPRRHFSLLLDDKGVDIEPLVVVEDENMMWEDEAGYVIKTPVCKYLYHKNCGGFSSIFDKDGNDWISYHNYGGSDGAYRGIPNLVFTSRGGTFHPGRAGCTSKLLSKGPIKISIESVSKEYGFTVRWDIYPEYATMTVVKSPIRYWFLYEGTPGGEFDEDKDYIVLANGETKKVSEVWHGFGVPWLIFANGKTDRGLFIIRHGDFSDKEDSYWPMEQKMTVWGFGRARKREPLNAYHKEVGLKITIGLVENANSVNAVDKVLSCLKEDRVLINK